MCCTRLAENTGSKNHAKNRHLRTIAQLCWAISSQLRHVSTIGKKLVKWPYLLHMSLQYGEPQPSNGWDQFRSLGHPSKFQRVSRLGFVTALTSLNGGQPNLARCSAVSCTGILYVHFGGGVSCIGIITARHSSSRRQPNFALWYTEWNYGISQRAQPIFGWAAITLGSGPRCSYFDF